jgi:hypothetical protein
LYLFKDLLAFLDERLNKVFGFAYKVFGEVNAFAYEVAQFAANVTNDVLNTTDYGADIATAGKTYRDYQHESHKQRAPESFRKHNSLLNFDSCQLTYVEGK